ncbi:hypothetical protein [Lysobacter hankyongensis]|uniref:Uncharacterized protein n=1 Tax=Lysobacter hankyongensis TaxID=1176535 RepID=A0ABP9B0V8_9GAMM
MPNSFAYELTMALVPGAVAGYYSGLLMAKQAKFNSLKHEALRCVRAINYVGDEVQTNLQRADRVDDLHLIAFELLLLKHRRAGEGMLALARRAESLVASCKLGKVPVEQVMASLSQWQEDIRALRPGLRFLLPWGQI